MKQAQQQKMAYLVLNFLCLILNKGHTEEVQYSTQQ